MRSYKILFQTVKLPVLYLNSSRSEQADFSSSSPYFKDGVESLPHESEARFGTSSTQNMMHQCVLISWFDHSQTGNEFPYAEDMREHSKTILGLLEAEIDYLISNDLYPQRNQSSQTTIDVAEIIVSRKIDDSTTSDHPQDVKIQDQDREASYRDLVGAQSGSSRMKTSQMSSSSNDKSGYTPYDANMYSR